MSRRRRWTLAQQLFTNVMTSDTTLRIWTPLNTVVVVRVPPNSTAAHTLQQLFATSTVAALVLGGLPGHEWDLYANLPLSDDTCTTADCRVCHSCLALGKPLTLPFI